MITPVHYIGEPAEIPLHQIEAASQVRTRNGFDEESLRELADSIKAVGLIEPIIVERTGAESFRIVAGERRALACSMAGLGTVPALVRPEDKTGHRLAVQIVENIQRVDLALSDRAAGVQDLVKEFGREKARKLLGKSPAWLSKHLSYAKLPALVREAAQTSGCEDFETLHCVAQLGKLDAAEHPKAFKLYDDALGMLTGGVLDRSQARAMLQDAQKPAAVKPLEQPAKAKEGTDLEPSDDDTDPTPNGTTKAAPPLTVKLEPQDAVMLRDLLEMAYTSGPLSVQGSERAKALHAMLRDAINNAYGI